MMAERPSALEGIRVIDAATLAAGPLVATAMGEFGAEAAEIIPDAFENGLDLFG